MLTIKLLVNQVFEKQQQVITIGCVVGRAGVKLDGFRRLTLVRFMVLTWNLVYSKNMWRACLGLLLGSVCKRSRSLLLKKEIWFPAINLSSVHGIDMKLGV